MLGEAVEAWGFRYMQHERRFCDRAEIARRWFAEEYTPVVRMLREADLIGSGTEAEAYMRVAGERYRLMRTHEWNDEIIRRLARQATADERPGRLSASPARAPGRRPSGVGAAAGSSALRGRRRAVRGVAAPRVRFCSGLEVEDVDRAGVGPQLGALALADLGGRVEPGHDLVLRRADVGSARVDGQLLELGAAAPRRPRA